MKTQKPKQWANREVQQLSKLARAGAGVSKIAAELGRHRIGEANGAKDRDTVEEVAVEEARMPRANDGITACLPSQASL